MTGEMKVRYVDTNGNEIEPPDPESFDEGSGTLVEHPMAGRYPIVRSYYFKSTGKTVHIANWPCGHERRDGFAWAAKVCPDCQLLEAKDD